MAVKLVAVAAFIACVRVSGIANPIAYGAPVARGVIAEPYDHIPQYFYGYEVEDSLIGNIHGEVERRNGDFVKGTYALWESDGTKRVVDYSPRDYSAHPVNGFNAQVSKEPPTRTVVTVPAYTGVAAPALHTTPLAAAPVVRNIRPVPQPSNFYGPLITRIGPAPLITATAPWEPSAVRAYQVW